MKNRYGYISTFEITSGVIDIADPYINSLAVAIERIPYANEKMVKVRRVLCGMYDAYHVINDQNDGVCGLLVLHSTYDLEDVVKDKHIYGLGYTSSGLSNAVSIVDERYRFDTSYCYNPIELEAYYDGNLILKQIPDMPYEDKIKTELGILVKNVLGQGDIIHPKGSELIKVIGERPIWNGFSEFRLNSSQWSVDIINRLSNSYSKGVGIKGGVASSSPGGYLSCFNFRNHRGDTYAIYVSLQVAYNEEINVWNIESMSGLDKL